MSDHPGIEDNAVSLLEFEGGVIGVSETGFVSKNAPLSWRFTAQRAAFLWAGPREFAYIATMGTYRDFCIPIALPEELPQAMTQWAEAIEGRGKIDFGLEEGILLTEIMEAAYRSQKEKRRVSL